MTNSYKLKISYIKATDEETLEEIREQGWYFLASKLDTKYIATDEINEAFNIKLSKKDEETIEKAFEKLKDDEYLYIEV